MEAIAKLRTLAKPHYKSLLNLSRGSGKSVKTCPALLTFLDLYHFPLRGQEQAEFMGGTHPRTKAHLQERLIKLLGGFSRLSGVFQ